MKDNRQKIEEELNLLTNNPHIDKTTFNEFINRLNEGEPFTKPQNPTSHFCVLFIPYHQKTNSVFIGHHVKTNFWIPPGGHLDLNETPREAVIREFKEELSFNLTTEEIELIDLNITKCVPGVICERHFDFFYLVYLDKKYEFKFDKKEFYDAKWIPIEQAVEKVNFDDFIMIFKKMIKSYK